MIHLVIAESKKGYDWFERTNDHLYAHSGSCCDYWETLFAKTNLMFCYRGSVGTSNLNYILYYPEISGLGPRTEKELNSVLTNSFQDILNLSKDKILYIFTTSQQVFNFFRIQIIKKEIKCEDLKISFIEEFYTDENDFNKIDLVVCQNGMIDHWPQRMFAKMASDCVEILRGARLSQKASNVPQAVTEKSPGTS